MANSILVLGNSGEGKSSSLFSSQELNIKGLDPSETFIINITNKPFPMRGWKKYYTTYSKENTKGNVYYSTSFETIIALIKAIPTIFEKTHGKPLKNLIIDDLHYLLTATSMSKVNEKGFDKFSSMAKGFYDVVQAGINLPENVNFICIAHTEIEEGAYKLKTIGKMIDSQINPIGYFTYVLTSTVSFDMQGKPVYTFCTNRTIDNRGILVPSKTPVGVFKDLNIPNDMGFVVEEIEKYNNGE